MSDLILRKQLEDILHEGIGDGWADDFCEDDGISKLLTAVADAVKAHAGEVLDHWDLAVLSPANRATAETLRNGILSVEKMLRT